MPQNETELEELERKYRALQQLHDRERKKLVRSEARAWERVQELETQIHRYSDTAASIADPPEWLAKQHGERTKAATAVLMLSDLHLDEVVDEFEMDGLNKYDRDVATKRFERIVNFTPELLREYMAGVGYEGLVVPLLGDIITGEIHEELAKTNEAPAAATVAHWVPVLASGLKHLADELDVPLHVPCIRGNHDRTGKRLQYKHQADEAWSWVVYNWLADKFAGDDRVTFQVSRSPEHILDIYDTTFLLHHGDGAKGGGGIGGIWPPIMRWVYKRKSSLPHGRRGFDYAMMGHWHQLTYGQDFVINGSMKGYDEFARGNAFGWERPQQALFVVTPGNGITMRTQVFCD